ncbi:MAG: hypothetical protein KDA54_03340 [Phycisphaerales bacterium]|nr:hypothetical protein [Phycisphaerales bacterium]
MAIQFNCISCLKAIEVADEWANRLVECPYCGDTVTAPGFSQLRAPAAAADETSSEPGDELQAVPTGVLTVDYSPAGYAPATHRGKFDGVALTALLLGIGAILLFFWIVYRFVDEVGSRVGFGVDSEEMTKFVQDAAETQQPWLVKLSVLGMGVMLLWFVATLVSVIALWRNRRERRGGLAYWAIGVNLLLPFFMVLSLLLQA